MLKKFDMEKENFSPLFVVRLTIAIVVGILALGAVLAGSYFLSLHAVNGNQITANALTVRERQSQLRASIPTCEALQKLAIDSDTILNLPSTKTAPQTPGTVAIIDFFREFPAVYKSSNCPAVLRFASEQKIRLCGMLTTMSAKDWLGQPYDVGMTVIYAVCPDRSVNMVIGEVVEFTDNGKVKIQPLKSSRWKQHTKRTYYTDKRNGKRIDPDAKSGKHIKVPSHYIETASGEKCEYRADSRGYLRDGGFYRVIDGKFVCGTIYDDRRKLTFVSRVYQDWVEKHVEDKPRPVTLEITANITVWHGDVPPDDGPFASDFG